MLLGQWISAERFVVTEYVPASPCQLTLLWLIREHCARYLQLRTRDRYDDPSAQEVVMENGRSFGQLRLVIQSIAALAVLVAFPSPSMAQLKVLISGGFSSAYRHVLPEFERTTGITVSTGSGASQGTGSQTIAAELQRGVPVDVVILSRQGLADLIAAGRIVAGTDVDLARVPLGAA